MRLAGATNPTKQTSTEMFGRLEEVRPGSGQGGYGNFRRGHRWTNHWQLSERMYLPPAARSFGSEPGALVLPGLRGNHRRDRQHSSAELRAPPRPLPSLRRTDPVALSAGRTRHHGLFRPRRVAAWVHARGPEVVRVLGDPGGPDRHRLRSPDSAGRIHAGRHGDRAGVIPIRRNGAVHSDRAPGAPASASVGNGSPSRPLPLARSRSCSGSWGGSIKRSANGKAWGSATSRWS